MDWTPPWTPGLPQARCAGRNCTWEGTPNLMVIAATLDANGLCVQCARTPDDVDRRLPQEPQATEEQPTMSTASTDIEQMALDL